MEAQVVLGRESLQVRGFNEGNPFRNEHVSFAYNMYIMKHRHFL